MGCCESGSATSYACQISRAGRGDPDSLLPSRLQSLGVASSPARYSTSVFGRSVQPDGKPNHFELSVIHYPSL